MRRILLLGSSGQVGWELARTLAPLGSLVAPPRRTLDLADADSTRAAIRAAAPNVIVNAAAYTTVDAAESEEAMATAVNGTAPGVIAEEAKRLSVPLVHFSTDYVFAGDATRPYRETDPVAPINAYGRSKLAGENSVREAGAAHLILRTSWIYARRGRNFLLTIARLAHARDDLHVVDDQTGSPTWARLVAEAAAGILAATGTSEGWQPLGERGGLYHLAAAGQCSRFEFASAIVARLAEDRASLARILPIGSDRYPLAAPRPAFSALDSSLLAERFGFRLPSWSEGLDLCLAGDALLLNSTARGVPPPVPRSTGSVPAVPPAGWDD